MKSLLLTSLLAFTLAIPASHSAVYVDSTFEDSSLGANGRREIVTTNRSNLTPWYLGNSTTGTNLEVVNDEGNLGKSLKMSRTNFSLTNFSKIELAANETLTISFDYRFAIAPNAGGENLRFMLFNSGDATKVTADVSSVPDNTSYSGYYFGIGAGAATSASSQTYVRKRQVGNSALLNSASGLTTPLSSVKGVESGTDMHSVQLTLTRGEDENLLRMTIDGIEIYSFTDSTGAFNQFDTLVFANQSTVTGSTIYFDNISVNVIPEAGTVSLSLLGSGALLYGMRRAKSSLKK